MNNPARESLIKELTQLLSEGNAHATFEQACAGLPAALRNKPVPDVPYTIWQLAEHVRIAQWDIVEFCLDPRHVSPKWPDGYWPGPDEKVDKKRWDATLAQVLHDRQRFIKLLQDPARDLLAPLPHGTGQTLLREALLIADHTAYHTGEIILVRRLLHAWS